MQPGVVERRLDQRFIQNHYRGTVVRVLAIPNLSQRINRPFAGRGVWGVCLNHFYFMFWYD